ncbi:MAG TPA: O-antigen ligase family protein [Saprospiraceae bacterium]|nr:O-antigen ligase family protein [Saprospiraceae bacterium]
MLKLVNRLFSVPESHPQGRLVVAFIALSLLCIMAGLALEMPYIALAPFGVGLLWLALVDFRKVFFLMLGCIPISTEVSLPGGLATDLPSEPLMWVLTLAGLIWFPQNWRKVDVRYLRHPITLALFAHLFWLMLTVVTSQNLLISFKSMLAKGWYVVVFYFWAGRFLNDERDFRSLLWWFFVPLFFATISIVYRHAGYDFSFESINGCLEPFFRNHVMYACLLAIFLPFVWYGTYWYRRFSPSWWWLVLGILVLLVGINFAYTRAAYGALVLAICVYWVVRLRWMKAALVAAALFFAGFVVFLRTDNNWLLFAPEFEKTISHQRFDRLLEATTKLEDISTMERVYRWVAASYMIQDRPLMGFGPATFYTYYKNYTVTSFRTYVSDNPEQSSTHNYFLMMAVEEGLPGLCFFLLFCVVVMLKGEKIYHQTKDIRIRVALLSALLCFVLINILMLMNDFIETDKIGSLFFLSAAILVNVDLRNRSLAEQETL